MAKKTTIGLLLVIPLLFLTYLVLAVSIRQDTFESSGVKQAYLQEQEADNTSSSSKVTARGTGLRTEAYNAEEMDFWSKETNDEPSLEGRASEVAALETSLLNSINAGRNPGIGDFMHLRNAYAKEGRLDDYRIFLELLPDSYTFKTEALGELAHFYAESMDFAKAFDLMETLRSREPDNGRLNYYLADLFFIQGNRYAAVSYYLISLPVADNPYKLYQLAKIFNDMGEIGLARQFESKAQELLLPTAQNGISPLEETLDQ